MDRLILYGAGQLGRRTASCLKDRFEIIFVDQHKAGEHIDGIRVLSLVTAFTLYGDNTPWVVTIYNGDGMVSQLRDTGVLDVRPVIAFYREHSDLLLPYACLEAEPCTEAEHEAFSVMYSLLADKESQDVAGRCFDFMNDLVGTGEAPQSDPAETYFPPFIKPIVDEVFVDCGAFDGDTLRQFLKVRDGKYNHIVCFEPDPESFTRLRSCAGEILPPIGSFISLFNCGVGAKEETVHFNANGTAGSCVADDGISVDITTIDRIVTANPPSYIKMDIEGYELEAIEGARQTIRDHSPVLGICLYHYRDHLWRIPQAIHDINPNYKLFIRSYAATPWETVCYAVPVGRLVA